MQIRLLNTLTQSLQSAGVDLSQANISVQIDLGKRANRGLTSGTLTSKV
jgi:sarcosine oxidase gamma subunit